MRHADARIAKLESDLSDMDKLAVYHDCVVKKAEAVLGRQPGTYWLGPDGIRQIALAIREIGAGEVAYGVRRLEDLLEEVRPDWREWL